MQASPKGHQTLSAVELRPGLAASEVHRHLRQGLCLQDAGQRILAFYLTEMEERGLHQLTGHSSTAFYAETRLGLDRRRVAELVRVGRKLLELRAIDRAFCDQQIGWSKVLELVKVAVPEHEEEWLTRARVLTCREFALEVRLSKAGTRPRAPGDRKGLPEIRFKVATSVGTLTHRKLELAKLKLTAERGAPVDDAELLDVLAGLFLNLEEDGSVPGRNHIDASLYRIVLRPDSTAPERLTVDSEAGAVPLSSRGGASLCCDAEHVHADGTPDVKTPAALRRRIIARDGARCRSCASRHRLMVHHIVYRADGGRTAPNNLVTLCVSCHALVHDDLLVLEGTCADGIGFADKRGEAVDAPGTCAAAGSRVRLAIPASEGPASEGPASEGPASEGPASEGAAPEEAVSLTQPAPRSRAEAFAGIVGQDALLQRLDATARGCRTRGKPFPHTLFMGPPGTGKTTLAAGVAARAGARLVQTCGPLVGAPRDMVALMARLGPGDMLFIDEIHAVPRAALEMLYDAMTSVQASFTLLAATTDTGDLPHALRSRFGLQEQLDFMDQDTLACLLARRAGAEDFELTPGAAVELAHHARGTPREAVRLLDRTLDQSVHQGSRAIDRDRVGLVLARLGFDADGLRPDERRYLRILRDSPVPVALGRLARQLGASARTLTEYIEPYLFRLGLVRMTARGRVAVQRPRLVGSAERLARMFPARTAPARTAPARTAPALASQALASQALASQTLEATGASLGASLAE